MLYVYKIELQKVQDMPIEICGLLRQERTINAFQKLKITSYSSEL